MKKNIWSVARLITLIVISLLVAGCEKESTDVTDNWELPPELAGYKVYKLSDTSGNRMTLIVPGNDQTKPSFAVEVRPKTPEALVIVNGKKYQSVEKDEK